MDGPDTTIKKPAFQLSRTGGIGSLIVRDPRDLLTEILELAEGDACEIEVVLMSDEEMDALPEFDGF